MISASHRCARRSAFSPACAADVTRDPSSVTKCIAMSAGTSFKNIVLSRISYAGLDDCAPDGLVSAPQLSAIVNAVFQGHVR